MKTLTKASPADCELNFEFGIAEQEVFNFLDKEELDRLLKSLEEKTSEPLRILDFFCATRYHTVCHDGKRKPLRFDYALLRLAFYRRTMELFIAHERGIQRIPHEDLVMFLTNRINNELKDAGLKSLTLKHIHAL